MILHILPEKCHILCEFNRDEVIIDLLDRQLIELLMQKANTTSVELSDQKNVSYSMIKHRKKNLLEQGIIRIFTYLDFLW
jgi:DNA-binding Lrp family transcriptional regulator